VRFDERECVDDGAPVSLQHISELFQARRAGFAVDEPDHRPTPFPDLARSSPLPRGRRPRNARASSGEPRRGLCGPPATPRPVEPARARRLVSDSVFLRGLGNSLEGPRLLLARRGRVEHACRRVQGATFGRWTKVFPPRPPTHGAAIALPRRTRPSRSSCRLAWAGGAGARDYPTDRPQAVGARPKADRLPAALAGRVAKRMELGREA